MARRYLITILVALGLAVAPLSAVFAAAPQDITLSPSSTELSAPAGGSASGSLSVINDGTSGFAVKTYIAPYHVTGIAYDPSFTQLAGTTDPSSWVHLKSPTTATIGPGATVPFSYTVEVPKGTAPGGYYAVAFAETLPPDGGGVSSHSRVGDILYITVQGPVSQAGTLKAGTLHSLIIGSNLPLLAEVDNTGGLHFVTTVTFKLINPISNKPVYTASLDRYVLPQTTRQITSTAAPKSVIGLYKVEISASILGQTQTLPTQWVLIVHPIVLWALPVIVILVLIYFRLPKKPPSSKTKGK
jgi:hypothetical protein